MSNDILYLDMVNRKIEKTEAMLTYGLRGYGPIKIIKIYNIRPGVDLIAGGVVFTRIQAVELFKSIERGTVK